MSKVLEKPIFSFWREKRLWRFFLFFFIVSFLVVNWHKVSWLFNQKAVYGELESIIRKGQTEEPKMPAAAENLAESPEAPEEFTDKEDGIDIPKLGISAPLIFPEGNSDKDFKIALKKGVVYYPDSVLPGQKGTAIILGHSSPSNWPKINYDWVFSNISKLGAGDEILIFFGHRQYIYKVVEARILEQGAEIPADWLLSEQANLVLLSCWPPGKDYKRFGILATLYKF